MTARTKPLNILAAQSSETKTTSISFEKPAAKASCIMIEAGNEKRISRFVTPRSKSYLSIEFNHFIICQY